MAKISRCTLTLVVGRAATIGTLAIVLTATPASASCAWVLWQRAHFAKQSLTWVAHSEHASLADCRVAIDAAKSNDIADAIEREKKKISPLPYVEEYICFPDRRLPPS